MEKAIEILCPDCGHDVLIHSAMFYHKHKGNICACELDKRKAFEKWAAQDRANTRRAALLEAAKSICQFCRDDGQAVKHPNGFSTYRHYSIDAPRGIDCMASKIHALLAQEQAQGGGGGQ